MAAGVEDEQQQCCDAGLGEGWQRGWQGGQRGLQQGGQQGWAAGLGNGVVGRVGCLRHGGESLGELRREGRCCEASVRSAARTLFFAGESRCLGDGMGESFAGGRKPWGGGAVGEDRGEEEGGEERCDRSLCCAVLFGSRRCFFFAGESRQVVGEGARRLRLWLRAVTREDQSCSSSALKKMGSVRDGEGSRGWCLVFLSVFLSVFLVFLVVLVFLFLVFLFHSLNLCRSTMPDAPDFIKCSITHHVMKDPVTTTDGHTYERTAITKWFETSHKSPMTGLQLASRQLIPNISVKKMIDDWNDPKNKQQQLQDMANAMFTMNMDCEKITEGLREVTNFIKNEEGVVLGVGLYERIETLINNMVESASGDLPVTLSRMLHELLKEHKNRQSKLRQKLSHLKCYKKAAQKLKEELQEELQEKLQEKQARALLEDQEKLQEDSEAEDLHSTSGYSCPQEDSEDSKARQLKDDLAKIDAALKEYDEEQQTIEANMGTSFLVLPYFEFGSESFTEAQQHCDKGDKMRGMIMLNAAVEQQAQEANPQEAKLYFVKKQNQEAKLTTYSMYQGEFKDGKEHGKGTITWWPTGDSYDGEWNKGERCGTGLYTWYNGDKYKGQFKNGKQHGKGKRTWDTEEEAVWGAWDTEASTRKVSSSYDGEWSDGLFEGKGVYTSRSDSQTLLSAFDFTYQGEFSGGFYWGQGTKTWAGGPDGGATYTGQWQYGEYHGEGTMKHEDGATYTGQFKEGSKHGKGTWKHGSESYEGQWENGSYHGKGKLATHPDGSKTYEGQWKDGRRHGEGTWKDGEDNVTYKGQWSEDKHCGRGFITYADGSTYKGQWENGMRHGQGTWKDGDDSETYEGQWSEHQRCGRGFITYADRSSYEGKWDNGHRHGSGIFRDQTESLIKFQEWCEGKMYKERITRPFKPDSEAEDSEAEDKFASCPRDKFKSSIFAITEHEKLPGHLRQVFDNIGENVVSIQLAKNIREDGRCFDELVFLLEYIRKRSCPQRSFPHHLIGFASQEVRRKLPSVLKERLELSEEEKTRYAATLAHKNGSLRYLEWIEVQAYLDKEGFDATLLNNIARKGSYNYEKSPSLWNQNNNRRPHLLLTLQRDHWQLLLRTSSSSSEASGSEADQRLCFWRHCEAVKATRDFDPMEEHDGRDSKRILQALLPFWEEDQKDSEAFVRKASLPEAAKQKRSKKRKLSDSFAVTRKRPDRKPQKAKLSSGCPPKVVFTPERLNGEWPQITLQQSQKLQTIAKAEQVNLDQLLEWNVAQLDGLTKSSTLKAGTSLLLPREFTFAESARLRLSAEAYARR